MMLNGSNDSCEAEKMAIKILNKIGSDNLSYTGIFYFY